jgi:uncharacterized protein YvpB
VTRVAAESRSTVVRALVLACVGALVLALAACGGTSRAERARPAPAPPAGEVVLNVTGRRFAAFPVASISRDGRVDGSAVARQVRRSLPRMARIVSRRARLVVAIDRGAVVRAVVQRGAVAQSVDVPVKHLSSALPTPVIRQLLHNNCESAALHALLATVGVDVGQLRLQSELPRSGPLDPVQRNGGLMWGDPEQGFVGRADGGGRAGGFGVYTRPMAALAKRHGVVLTDLSRHRISDIYAAVLAGRPVLAWVGLNDGPFRTWRSPAGRPIRVNFSEHTIVLAGARRNGTLSVVNPLTGKRESWTRERFEEEWSRLDRRALAPAA